jgi:hypothetical protein
VAARRSPSRAAWGGHSSCDDFDSFHRVAAAGGVRPSPQQTAAALARLRSLVELCGQQAPAHPKGFGTAVVRMPCGALWRSAHQVRVWLSCHNPSGLPSVPTQAKSKWKGQRGLHNISGTLQNTKQNAARAPRLQWQKGRQGRTLRRRSFVSAAPASQRAAGGRVGMCQPMKEARGTRGIPVAAGPRNAGVQKSNGSKTRRSSSPMPRPRLSAARAAGKAPSPGRKGQGLDGRGMGRRAALGKVGNSHQTDSNRPVQKRAGWVAIVSM